MRISHRALDPEKSTDFQPVQSHLKEAKLAPEEIVPVDIAFYPHGRIWHAGETYVWAQRTARRGGWRLVGWGLTDGDTEDKFLPPLGHVEDCGGLLIYSPSGAMSATLSHNNRPHFQNSSLDGGTVEERAGVFGTIVAYSGTFITDDATNEVTHVVDYATLPHFVDQRMRGICIFEGDRLKLDTPSMIIGGVSRVSHIEWQRI